MGDLRGKIQAARKRFEESGTEKLAAAKQSAERALIRAAETGERTITFQRPALAPGEIAAFDTWLRAEGVLVELVHDQRDGDFYRLAVQA